MKELHHNLPTKELSQLRSWKCRFELIILGNLADRVVYASSSTYINCKVNDYILYLRCASNHTRRFASIGKLAIAQSSINNRVKVIWGDTTARWDIQFPARLPIYGSSDWNSSSCCRFHPLLAIFLRLSWQHQAERKHIRQLKTYRTFLIPKSVFQHSWPCRESWYTSNIISETIF